MNCSFKSIVLVLCGMALLSELCEAGAPQRPVNGMFTQSDRMKTRKEKAFAKKLAKEMFAVKPLLRTNPNVVTTHGGGTPELMRMHDLNERWLHQVKSVGLPNGVLYYVLNQDAGDEAIWLHVDTSAPLTQRIKDRQEELKALIAQNSDHKGTVDIYTRQAERLRGIRTAADFDMLRWLEDRGGMLTEGPLALNPNQFGLLSGAYNKRMKAAEDLAKLLPARNTAPSLETDKKMLGLFEQIQNLLKLAEKEGNLFAPNQRMALGYDPDPNNPFTNGRAPKRMGIAAGTSASAGNFDDAKYKAMEAKREELKKNARIRFALKGISSPGSKSSGALSTSAGKLWVWEQGETDGTSFVFALEPGTWEEEKAELQTYWKDMTDEKIKSSGARTRASYELLKRAKSSAEYTLGTTLEALRIKTGSVTPEAEERVRKLIEETNRTADELLKVYSATLEKPQDAAQQRKLVDAYSTARKNYMRGLTLCDRLNNDHYNLFGHLPWVLTLEQADYLADEPTSGSSNISSVHSGPDGAFSNSCMTVTARPQGKLQYVSITTENVTIEDVAEQLELAAIHYYHQRDLQIIVDPAALEKQVRGTVEGTSMAELLKNTALRSGTTASQDPKNANIWYLKP